MHKYILIITISLLLTGCFDRVNLEERGLVLGIGIDKYDKKDKDDKDDILSSKDNNRFVVSIALPEVYKKEEEEKPKVPKENQDKKDSSEKNKAIKKGIGETITTTMNLIDTATSKKLYYGHTKVVILGKDILSDSKLFKETINALERHKEISRKLIILGSNELAEKVLETIPKDREMIGLYINDFYKNNKGDYSFTHKIDLEDLVQNLLETGDSLLPNVSVENGNIRLDGLFIMKDFEVVERLTDSETEGLLMLIDNKSFGEISTLFERNYISLSILKKKIDEKIYNEDGKIIFDFNIDIDTNISEYLFDENIIIDSEKYKKVQDIFNKYFEDKINKSLEKIQKTKADVLKLKKCVEQKAYNLYKMYNLEDKNIYDFIKFKVNINTIIKTSGNIK